MRGLRGWLTAAALLVLPLGAQAAECVGRDLIDALPAERRAEIEAAAAAVPYHQGILWQAERGAARITLVGTYHFGDERHQSTLAALGPALTDAAALLVEAGPEEEARLSRALAEDPSLMVDPTGPTLPERLEPEEWQTLSAAMDVRGMPAMIASKLRPWYVAMMLGVSPCMLKAMVETGETGGLDHLLIAKAEAAEVPVRALEPWDTVFTLFRGLTPEQEIGMIRASLPAAEYADDYAVTLTDAYFRGDIWAIWEFGRFDAYANSGLSRAEVDEQITLARTKLMDERNAAWIAPIQAAAEAAAAEGKGIVAGFGALHLPGEAGVLRLLQRQGWTIRPLKGAP